MINLRQLSLNTNYQTEFSRAIIGVLLRFDRHHVGVYNENLDKTDFAIKQITDFGPLEKNRVLLAKAFAM